MKTFKYILVLCIMVTAMACDRSDDSNFNVLLPDKPSFDESTVYGKRMKEFFDKYGIWCQYNVSANDLFYTWTGSENWTSSALDYEYEEANAEYIVKALDFLENEVMINMPVSILDEYLGLYIAFEGRVFHSCELEDGLDYTSKEDYPGIEEEFEESAYGWNGSRYLLLAPVGPEFDKTDKETLKREWTALIFYEALKNLPNPDAFEDKNSDAWDAFAYFYYDYLVGDHEDGWAYNDYLGKYQGPYTDGLVSPGPISSATLMDGYDDEENGTGFYAMIYKWYGKSSCLDAFAAYVGYIMYASAEEKAEIRSQSDNVLVNERLVKEYCKKHLNWDIPELGEK